MSPDERRQLSPAAIVSATIDLRAMAQEINGELADALTDTQSSLEHYRHAGELLLKARQHVGQGYWEAWLKANTTVSRSQTYSYMRLAQHWTGVADATSLRAALQIIVSGAPDITRGGTLTVFCDRCQRVGPVARCTACQDMRMAARAEQREAKVKAKAKAKERQPGDDTESEAKDRAEHRKVGKPVFEWKTIAQGMQLTIRAFDAMGNAFGVPQDSGMENLRRRLNALHRDARELYKQFAKEHAPETPDT